MIFLIILLSLILRLINLNQSLWLDEATQVLLSKEPVRNIIFQRGADFHPPLSYILMHFWEGFGTSEIWLRLLSVLFGVLTIWVIYRFSSEIFGKKVGILSALLLSLAPYHIYYSQEVRMYSETTFFGTLSIYLFYLLIKKRRLIYSLGYIFSSTALIYTHYDGFFLIIAQLIYLWIFEKNLLFFLAKRAFFIFLLYLPWLPQMFVQLSQGINIDQYLPGWRDILSLDFYKAIPLTFLKFSIGRINFDNQLLYIFVAATVLMLFGFVLFCGIKKNLNKDSTLLIFWLFIPIIISLLVSLKLPINQPFRLLYTLPAFYILLSKGLDNLGNYKNIFTLAIVFVSIFGLLIYYTNSRYWREDWRGASKFILKNVKKDSSVIFAWPEPFSPYKWYGNGKSAIGVVQKFPARREDVKENLRYIDRIRDIFFFEYLQQLSDPQKYIQKTIEDNGFKLDKVYNFNGVGFIDYYVKK